MAIVKARTPDEQTLTPGQKVGLPKDAYVARCISEEFGKSKSSGNPMITQEWEIVSPDTIKDAQGRTIACGGHKFTKYWSLQSSDPKKTPGLVDQYIDFCKKAGHELSEFDDENPPLFCEEAIKNQTPIQMDVVLYGKKSQSFNAQGKPILIGGKPVETFQTNVDSFYGLSTLEVNKPY